MFKDSFFKTILILCFLFPLNFLLVADNNLIIERPNTAPPHFFDSENHDVLAKKIVNAMTDEQLLSQIFMFGWAGQAPNDLVVDWVGGGLGSIKIFGWNTGDTKKLAGYIKALQEEALKTDFGIPLFVATDQEGGLVRHVKGLTTETPGNLALGASGVPIDAYYSGYYISHELAKIGINLNFAPTVDLYTNHNSSVIGPRSFGESPQMAAILGEAFMRGSHDAGVLTTAKHFPGHGDTALDSHGRLPQINISKETLYNRELVPFKYLIDNGISAVMTGHLNYPCLVEKGKPATFSSEILQDLLRKELGFSGLIITDDIMMHGAINYAGSLSKAVTWAIEAGNDIIESSTTPRKHQGVWLDNIKKMRDDEAFKKIVMNSAYRIIFEKLKYFKSNSHVKIIPNMNNFSDKLLGNSAESFFQSFAARATTIVRNKLIPYSPQNNEKIILASAYANFLIIGKRRFPQAQTTSLINAVYSRARDMDTVIFCISNQQSLNVFNNLNQMYPNKKYIIISSLSPVYLKEVNNSNNTIIAVYSYSDFSFIAGFAALCGDYTPIGKMPLSNIN